MWEAGGSEKQVNETQTNITLAVFARARHMEHAFLDFQAQQRDDSSSDASFDITGVFPSAVLLAAGSAPEPLVAPPTPDGNEEAFVHVGEYRHSSDDDAPLTPSLSEDDMPLSRMAIPPSIGVSCHGLQCAVPFIPRDDIESSLRTSTAIAATKTPAKPALGPLRATGKAWERTVALRHGDKLDLSAMNSDMDDDGDPVMHRNTWLAEGVMREVWCQVGKTSTRQRYDFSSSHRPLDMTDALISSIDEAGLRMENVSF